MNPALKYAEETLGVHASYERALDAHKELDEITTELDKAQDKRRVLTERISEREIDLLIAERGKHSDMSEAGLERHLKAVKAKDVMLVELRSQLGGITAQINGLEYDADMFKLTIKIETARMEELGGYFRFLAAVKEAENLTKRESTT